MKVVKDHIVNRIYISSLRQQFVAKAHQRIEQQAGFGGAEGKDDFARSHSYTTSFNTISSAQAR